MTSHLSPYTQVLIAFSLGAGVAGCSHLLPETHTDASTFNSFEEARAAIESLVPMKSDKTSLTAMGIEPGKQPNTTLLTHADAIGRLVPGSIVTKQDLDPGIVACIEARDACHGLALVASRIDKVRNGNFFADFLNFSQRTVTTGWRFTATILLVNDVVVYRSWAGQPSVKETEVRANPLGPLQDIGPSAVTSH